MLPVGSPKANWSQVRGQTKYGSKYPMENRGVRRETLPGGSLVPASGARPGRRARERAPGARGPAGQSLKEQRGTSPSPIPWTHHLQDEPLRSIALLLGWQWW